MGNLLSASFCHNFAILLIDWHIPILFGLLDPQDKGTMILKNAGKYSPSDTATAQKTCIFRNAWGSIGAGLL
jgi:hypothetical protein